MKTDSAVAPRIAFDDAERGAVNQHDANFLTFHRVENFRMRAMKVSAASFRAPAAGRVFNIL